MANYSDKLKEATQIFNVGDVFYRATDNRLLHPKTVAHPILFSESSSGIMVRTEEESWVHIWDYKDGWAIKGGHNNNNYLLIFN